MTHPIIITSPRTSLKVLIHYSTFTTPFGSCLVASTTQGISNVLFFDDPEEGLRDLQSHWPRGLLKESALPYHTDIEQYIAKNQPLRNIPLHVHGTPFQISVWQSLLTIPSGQTTTYGAIAKELGASSLLSRAVGTAVGANPIGYVIPCHRVLKSNGDIGDYRWGVEKKRAMLAWESDSLNNQVFNAPLC